MPHPALVLRPHYQQHDTECPERNHPWHTAGHEDLTLVSEAFSPGCVVEGEEECGGEDVADSLGADGDAAKVVLRCGGWRVRRGDANPGPTVLVDVLHVLRKG